MRQYQFWYRAGGCGKQNTQASQLAKGRGGGGEGHHAEHSGWVRCSDRGNSSRTRHETIEGTQGVTTSFLIPKGWKIWTFSFGFLSSYNKIPETDTFIKNRHVFSVVLKTEKSTIRCSLSVCEESCPLLPRWVSLLCTVEETGVVWSHGRRRRSKWSHPSNLEPLDQGGSLCCDFNHSSMGML